MEQIRLRAATEADSDFAYGLLKVAMGEYIAQTWGWHEGEQRRLHNARFRPEDTRIIVEGDSEIGLLAADHHDDYIRLRQVFLVPEAQGRGIGSMLVGQILEEADRRHLPVRLRVLRVNCRARAFYERLGFSVTGETDTHCQMEYGKKGTDTFF